MPIIIFPERNALSRQIKRLIKLRLKTAIEKDIVKSRKAPFLRLYILKEKRQLSGLHIFKPVILKVEKIGETGFKKIAQFSFANSFRRYLNKFKKGRGKYRYIYLSDKEIVFISGEKEIVYFIYERNNNNNNIKQWIRHIVFYCISFYKMILCFDYFPRQVILHAAGIAKDSKGYLFLGDSGSGKSTICRFSKKCQILDDDIVRIESKNTDKEFKASSLENPLNEVKVKSIFFLKKSKQNRLVKMTTSEALKKGLRNVSDFQSNHSFLDMSVYKIDLAMDFFKSVPSYKLYFKRNSTFWKLIDSLKN